jgi:hypothetical protein
VFSTRTVRQLRDATIELLGEVFSMRFVPRCYKHDKSKVQLVAGGGEDFYVNCDHTDNWSVWYRETVIITV